MRGVGLGDAHDRLAYAWTVSAHHFAPCIDSTIEHQSVALPSLCLDDPDELAFRERAFAFKFSSLRTCIAAAVTSAELAGFRDKHGNNALYLAAYNRVNIDRNEDLRCFLAYLLDMGLDPIARNHHGCTSFMALLGISGPDRSEVFDGPRDVPALLAVWAKAMRDADLSLLDWVATENFVWSSLNNTDTATPTQRPNETYFAPHMVFLESDGTLRIAGTIRRKVDIFEWRPPPGTFPASADLPPCICWSPHQEEDCGSWREARSLTVRSKLLIFDEKGYDDRGADLSPFIESVTHSLDGTQDDNGPIAYHLHRRLRRSRSALTSTHRRRSTSMPPSIETFLAGDATTLCGPRTSHTKSWLPQL